MDTIKFTITEPQPIRGTEKFKSIEAIVSFGDEELPHSIFNTNQVLAAHNFKFAEFDLFTCSCGEPGCAGFQSPVTQKINNDVVSWIFPIGDGYKTKKNIYTFDIQQFNDAFSNFTENLVTLEKQNIFMSTQFDLLGFEEEEYEASDPIGIEEGISFWTKRLKSEEQLHLVISTHFPTLMDKEFYVTHAGVTTNYGVNVVDLICSILNQYPRDILSNFYLKKATLTAKAIEQTIKGDNSLLIKIINNSYAEFKYGLTPTDFVDRWFYDENKQFSLNQIGISN